MFDTGPHSFEMDKWISCAPFEKLLNIEIVKAENGEAILQMPFLLEYAQGAGLMHGGAIVALADTTVVMAIKSILPKGTHFATIKMDAEFLNPVTKGIIRCYAKIEKGKEERIFLGSATVCNEDDKEVMIFNSTFKIARKTQIKNIKFND